MSRRLTHPRHVLISLLLAAVLGTTGVLATGASTTAPEIEPFHVPLPRVGDRAAYITEHVTRTLADGTSYRWMDHDVLAFAWDEDLRVPNGTGVLQTMNVLHTRQVLENQDSRWDHNRSYYLGVDGHLQGLGGARGLQYQYERPNTLVPVVNNTSTSTTNMTSMQFIDAPPYWLGCGIRNALQGHRFDATDIPLEPWSCSRGPHPELQHRFRTVALGHDEEGRRILEVDLVEARSVKSTVATYWMQEGNPYPVQVRIGSREQPVSTAHLVVEEEGDRPIGQDADLVALGLTVSAVPRPEWGIDDSGVDHPYPLSVAYKEALAHPDAEELRAYLAAHPEAYLARAQFGTSSSSPSHEGLDWYLVWSDGPTEHIAWISRDRGSQEVAGTPVPGTEWTETRFQSRDGEVRTPWPDPGQVPAHGPTAAEALAWFAAFEEAPHQVGYGFYMGCMRAEDDTCAEARLTVEAGWQRFEREGADPMYQRYDDRIAQSWVDLAEGRLESRYASQTHWANDVRAPVAPPGDSATGAHDVMAFTVKPSSWTWPSVAQTAGIAGASLLIGLLYWLWPALKTAPAALFSRIEKHDLLDHPVRRAIHQAVEAEPGVHYQGLLRTTGLANGTLDHHLQQLVRAGLVKSVKGPGYTCYFDASVGRQVMQAAPVLKSDGARKVLAAVQAAPGTAPKDVALKAGLSPQTVHYHLHRLREAGLVLEERDGRKVALRAA